MLPTSTNRGRRGYPLRLCHGLFSMTFYTSRYTSHNYEEIKLYFHIIHIVLFCMSYSKAYIMMHLINNVFSNVLNSSRLWNFICNVL